MFLSSFCISAQTVAGKWYGTGYVKSATEHNNYLTELIIDNKKNEWVGFFNFYFRDSLFSNPIKGIFDAKSRKLLLQKQPIIFYKSTNTKIGIDCFLKSDFTYRVSKVDETLSGVLYPDKSQQFTCPEIYFSFKRADSTKETPIETTIADTTTTLLNEAEILFTQRTVSISKSITIESDSIEIELTDNGEIDGDIVSIFLDGKLLLAKKNLSYKPIVYTIALNNNKPEFVLCMYAENTGLIAPNTALLTIKDGSKKYEMEISSSLSSTTGIVLKKNKK
jgi:hypothetical protein